MSENKKPQIKKLPLIIALLLVVSALLVGFFILPLLNKSNVPLDITLKSIEKYNVYIDMTSSRMISRTYIEKAVELAKEYGEDENSLYSKKYDKLLSQNLDEYLLYDVEILELSTPFSDKEKAEAAWKELEMCTVEVSGTGDGVMVAFGKSAY